jgi:hypothetical protein
MDPIEGGLRLLFNMSHTWPTHVRVVVTVIQVIGVVVLAACFLRKNFVGHEERQREIAWSALCGALTRQTATLIPVYNDTFDQFHMMVAKRMEQHPIVDLTADLDTETMMGAERDLYEYDLNNTQTLSLLYMQLEGYVTHNSQEGQSHGMA